MGETETRVWGGFSVVGETEMWVCTYLGDGGEGEGSEIAILAPRVSVHRDPRRRDGNFWPLAPVTETSADPRLGLAPD